VDEPTGATLREGRDFATAQELARQTRAAPGPVLPAPPGLALAAAALDEVLWLLWTGCLPGRLCWDAQPAWRVGLWQAFLTELERRRALLAELS
jgi:hypothetical protein